MKPTLEKYLKDNHEKGIIDHVIRVSHVDQNGNPHFYIHPQGHDGDTLDFVSIGNWIVQKHTGADKTIRFNGEKRIVQADVLSYEEILELAGLKPGIYSVIYSIKNGMAGTLSPQQSVNVVDGMSINAMRTNNA